MTTVTATELARHTREVLDQVLGKGERIAVERNHRIVAEIVPPTRLMTASQVLRGLAPMMTAAEGDRWLIDSRNEFDEEPLDPWA